MQLYENRLLMETSGRRLAHGTFPREAWRDFTVNNLIPYDNNNFFENIEDNQRSGGGK